MAPDLVIFDCDGVLVDSEHASARVLAEAMAAVGVAMPADEVAGRYRALALELIEDDVARRRGAPLPPGWTERFRERRAEARGRSRRPTSSSTPPARSVTDRIVAWWSRTACPA